MEGYGLIATRCGAYRNRQYTEYWLNETQAVLVCVLSRTERAAEVRRALIAVFTAWRRGQLAFDGLPGELTRAERKTINSRAYALASEEIRTAFQKHQARLIRGARDLLAAGRNRNTSRKQRNNRMKGYGGTVSETRHHPVTSTEDRAINDAGLKSAPLCAVAPGDIKAVVSGR